MGQQIPAVADFGAFPGTDVANVVVTTNASFLTTSDAEAWVNPNASLSDFHTEEDLSMLTPYLAISIPQSLKVAATSFTVRVLSPDGFLWGKIPLNTVWN